MINYLDFKNAKCKNCYKCLRECPVKAIAVINHQAKIIDDRCILCGTCTHVCPQNAKIVHSEIDKVLTFFERGEKVVASVAPSFVSSFHIDEFSLMKIALGKLGFYDAEETSVGANAVVKKYYELLEEGGYKNFITSSCPAVNRLIQLYFPKALPYLARVDSPMVAHAKMLKKQFKDAKIVFIGPCIAKKREGEESGLIDAVLTYEDLKLLFEERHIVIDDIASVDVVGERQPLNRAKFFPISRGVIKSFEKVKPTGYEYMAIDGVQKCMEVLGNIENLDGVFLELNACDYACINGPCSLNDSGYSVVANAEIRKYVTKDLVRQLVDKRIAPVKADIDAEYPRLKNAAHPVSEREIKEILAKTGKLSKDDELNCGACGYSTCREKAWAVANGFAELEMCVPYMRERAETMSYEIIQNSPNGIVVVDYDLKIVEMSKKAKAMLGVKSSDPRGENLVDYINPTEFILAMESERNIFRKRIKLDATGVCADVTITVLAEHKVMFAIMTDITDEVSYDERLNKVRNDTIATTDEVIKKQMRVAQEIASLLGETTAETKVALLKLKKALSDEEKKGDK